MLARDIVAEADALLAQIEPGGRLRPQYADHIGRAVVAALTPPPGVTSRVEYSTDSGQTVQRILQVNCYVVHSTSLLEKITGEVRHSLTRSFWGDFIQAYVGFVTNEAIDNGRILWPEVIRVSVESMETHRDLLSNGEGGEGTVITLNLGIAWSEA